MLTITQEFEQCRNQLHTLLKKIEYTINDINHQFPQTQESSGQILPRISIKDCDVVCNGMIIPLGRKPLTKKLFEIFIENRGAPVKRWALIEGIYGALPEGCSSRYRKALEQNFIKLISRARALADMHVNRSELKWIEWFCFNQESECWEFFRLTNEYLAELPPRV